MGWSWFESTLVRVRTKRGEAWQETMPMHCPACGLPWSDEGIVPIRGQTYTGWGSPPGTATRFHQCKDCGHQAYARKL